MKPMSFPKGFLLPRLPSGVVAEHSRVLKPLEETIGESIVTHRHGAYTPTAASIRALEASGKDVLFSAEALKEAAAIPNKSPLLGQREKVKGVVFSIAPEGTRDLDAAFSIRKGPKGTTIVGAHATDISAAVRWGSALDAATRRRVETRHLHEDGLMLPLLPVSLTEGKLSLLEGKPRLTKSIEVTFGPSGDVVSHRVFRSALTNQHALDYAMAGAAMEGRGRGKQTPALRAALNQAAVLWRKAARVPAQSKAETLGPMQFENLTGFFADKASALLGDDLAIAGNARFTGPTRRHADIEVQRAMDRLIDAKLPNGKRITLEGNMRGIEYPLGNSGSRDERMGFAPHVVEHSRGSYAPRAKKGGREP